MEGKLNYLENIGLEQEIKSLSMTKKECLEELKKKPHESKIISIPRAKHEFVEYFREILHERKTTRKLIKDDDLEPCYFHKDPNQINRHKTM